MSLFRLKSNEMAVSSFVCSCLGLLEINKLDWVLGWHLCFLFAEDNHLFFFCLCAKNFSDQRLDRRGLYFPCGKLHFRD